MKRPSFQFYPQDWLSDPNVIAMTVEQRGAYIQILAAMWTTDDCSLPANEEYLAKIAQVDRSAIAQLSHCFQWGDRLRHKRLDEERKKQDEHREERSKSGKLGNKIRWHKPKEESSLSDRSAIAKHRSSSSSSSSNTLPKGNGDEASLKEKKHGNEKINQMLEFLRQAVGVTDFKEPRQQQRQCGNNLVRLMEKLTRQVFAARLEAILANNFHRKNCGSLDYIYRQIKGFVSEESSISKIQKDAVGFAIR